MSSDKQRVEILLPKLQKWIRKREAKALESGELKEAVRLLENYHVVLLTSEVMRNGGQDGIPNG